MAQNLSFEWSRVRLVCDPPTKIKQPAPDTSLVFEGIRHALGKPSRSIDLISPYFVPGKKGTAALAEFAEHGIALRVLTNSLAATDVGAVHAGYARTRAPLLRSGAKIYELKPDGTVPGRKRGARMWRGSGGSSSVSLHAKTFAVDRAHLFVGSMNLDPRSIRLNTEMGLLIESERLAETVAKLFDETVAHTTYEVVLASNGDLEWIERTDGDEVRYRAEPKTRLLRRLGVWLMALLPIEWLL
jgi:putative cardiolipin synthase